MRPAHQSNRTPMVGRAWANVRLVIFDFHFAFWMPVAKSFLRKTNAFVFFCAFHSHLSKKMCLNATSPAKQQNFQWSEDLGPMRGWLFLISILVFWISVAEIFLRKTDVCFLHVSHSRLSKNMCLHAVSLAKQQNCPWSEELGLMWFGVFWFHIWFFECQPQNSV